VPVETRRFDSVDAFLTTAGRFLETREPEHMLTLGVLGELKAQGGTPGDGALVTAEADGLVVATGLWRPPWNVVLSEIDDKAALAAIAHALVTDELAGVHAPAEHAEAFSDAWCERTGARPRPGTRQRSYVLDTVFPPRDVPGGLRLAHARDRERMVDWMVAFDVEALGPEAGRQNMRAFVDAMLDSPTRTPYIWEVAGEPVSMCQATGRTPRGIRIGAVYTPPEHRRRGYASAMTAAASQEQLDQGRRWCFLFTDLSNPTSNRIYQAIGYRPIRDVQLIHFDQP
jgi:predicted GNAT family acetyltransferase